MGTWKNTFNDYCRIITYKILSIIIAYPIQGLMRLILATCRWEVEGVEKFKELAANKPCILSLWHNRLAISPFILYKFAPDFIYAAVISKSRDGELLDAVVRSYKAGRTIRVATQQRHQALRDILEHLKQGEIVIITPDGPRGPCYEVKPGLAWTARETSAYVFPLTWTASKYWELNTWDRLRFPKPFSKIKVEFRDPLSFSKEARISTVSESIKQGLG